MDTVHQWYKHEVYRWRTGASIVWSLFTLPPLVITYLFVVRISIFHPIDSVFDFFSYLFSWTFVLYLSSLLVVYFILCVYNSCHFSVLPDIAATRLESMTSHMRGSKLMHGLVTAMGGVTIAWCLSGFIGDYYGQMYGPCTTYGNGGGLCFNEQHLVFILHALFTGLLHHYTFYSQQKNYLQFPAVFQPKLFHIKSSLTAIIVNSFMNTLSSLKFFYLWYFFCGDVPKLWLMANLNLSARSLPPINSLYGMLNLPLFIHLLLCGTLLRLIWNISHLLYKLYNTEPFMFPIDTPYESFQNKCLHNGLVCQSAPLVQYLSFLDVQRLSVNDPLRRRELFTLSQPGGHPHNWNRISAACLAQIDAFNESLQQVNWASVAQTHLNGEVANGIKPSTLNGNARKPTARSFDPIRIFLQKLYENVKTKPVICYLLNKIPEAEARRMFAATQTHLWAIDALSNLIYASYTEDQYGIVQRSLPTVLVSLLNLHENVEKYFKLTSTATRRQRDQLGSHDSGLRHNMRHMTKTSLYRIVDLFGKHLQEFNLGEEQKRKLRQFQDYKE